MSGGMRPADTESVAGERPRSSTDVVRSLYELVVITDLDGRVIQMNSRARRAVGGDLWRQRHISQCIEGLREPLLSRIHADFREGRYTVLDATCRRSDGSRFPAEVSVSGISLDGRDYLLFSIRSLEWRVSNLADLRMLEAAVQSVRVAIVVTDMDGDIQSRNPCFDQLRRAGGDSRPSIGSVREFFNDGTRLDSVLFGLMTGQPWSGQLTAGGDASKPLLVHVSAAPCYDNKDELVGFVFALLPAGELEALEPIPAGLSPQASLSGVFS